jgi:ankyrin repeat protein
MGLGMSSNDRELWENVQPVLCSSIRKGDVDKMGQLIAILTPSHLHMLDRPVVSSTLDDLAVADYASIHLACRSGNRAIVAALLTARPQLAKQKTVTDALTPFLIASKHGHVKIMSLLLKNGATLKDTVPKTGDSAIHLAAKSGHKHAVLYLAKHSTRNFLKVKNKSGETALDCAINNLRWPLVDLIKSHLNNDDVPK